MLLHILLARLGGLAALGSQATAPSEIVLVKSDDTVIESSCSVAVAAPYLADAAGDGVVQIVADDVTVDFAGTPLVGGDYERHPDRLEGVGIRVTGKRVVLKNASVHGFRVGIEAIGADGLVLEDCDVSNNFRQRLRSTPNAEAGADWLWPHANDEGEWTRNYGAGIHVADARDVTVRRCRARDGQNGLILDRVTESRVYDNDFSFLSGWGVALWRSCRNVISRNALDFCVRGYSHGLYNRGQDSAGILMFEQCSENVVAENSATHGGDGFFGFAGREALGEAEPPSPDFDYTRRGNNDNLIFGNDFSYAAAHGIEMTFSFGNELTANRLVENAICGVWGGYSKDTIIAGNELVGNGEMAYGLERGGINIEHGERNRIVGNAFRGNRCGVHLWWDPDEHLTKLPWSVANGHGSANNSIYANRFEGDELAVQLRECRGTVMAGNAMVEVGAEVEATPGSEPELSDVTVMSWATPEAQIHGRTRPVGARAHLRGREHIVLTEWGPYDWQEPHLQRLPDQVDGTHIWLLLGVDAILSAKVSPPARMRIHEAPGRRALVVQPERAGRVVPYTLEVETPDGDLVREGLLITALWEVVAFGWRADPREDEDAWAGDSRGGVFFETALLDFAYGAGGPSQLPDLPPAVAAAELPADRFGTIAVTDLVLPAGKWRIRTVSDDGIRVFADGRPIIEDWTWHPPREHEAVLEIERERTVWLEVHHFELDGHAVLSVEIEPVHD